MNARVIPPALFEPFSWTTPAADKASTFNQLGAICRARDVAAGLAVIMAVLERDEVDEGCEIEGQPIPKLFSEGDRGHLQRLAVTSLGLLADSMDSAINRANEYAQKRAGQ